MLSVFGLACTVFVAGWVYASTLQRSALGVSRRSFGLLGVLIAVWAIGELLIATAATPDEAHAAARIFFLSGTALPVAWFWLGARSADAGWYVRDPRRAFWALPLPVVFYTTLHVDAWDLFLGWDGEDFVWGPWFPLFRLHQYALCLIGTFYFVRAARGLRRMGPGALAMFLIGGSMPMGANVLFALGLTATNWTVVSLGPAALLLWTGAVEAGLISNPQSDRDDVIDQLDVGVVVANPDGRVVGANGAARRLTGLTRLRGRLMEEIVAAAEERPDAAIEARSLNLRARFGTSGWALILTDRTEAEVSRRRLELAGRLEALGSLTAGIAHEVNNPLAFIQANLSMLEQTVKEVSAPSVREGVAPSVQEAVLDLPHVIAETQEGVERIRELVARLKNFSRTPDVTATPVEIDLARAAREAGAVATVGRTVDTLVVRAAPDMRVLSVETAVFQILVNLILNAVQAGPEEGRVEIVIDERDRGIAIQILDEGPGIPEALLPRIFDPFFTTKPTGTGLGLALSFDLARQLGGELVAANREAGGACFSLWLPRVPPVEPIAGSEPMAHAPASSPAVEARTDAPQDASPVA